MLRVLDLFSGIGGFAVGLERTGGFQTVAFCEINPFCRAVLRKRWPHVPLYEDIRAVTAARLRADGIEADVLCGGFPCQDISVAGTGGGLAGARSGLWEEYRRLIEETHPQWAIIENVSALRARGLEAMLGQLAALGYDAEWHCIPAAAVGAPHRRDRIWVIAYPQCLKLREQPRGSRRASRAGASLAVGDGSFGIVADANGGRCEGEWIAEHAGQSGTCGSELDGLGAGRQRDGANVADSGIAGFPLPQRDPVLDARRWQEGRAIAERGWWRVEPDVGRVANGVPARAHRLRALGNAVVPQIVQMLGLAILEQHAGIEFQRGVT